VRVWAIPLSPIRNLACLELAMIDWNYWSINMKNTLFYGQGNCTHTHTLPEAGMEAGGHEGINQL